MHGGRSGAVIPEGGNFGIHHSSNPNQYTYEPCLHLLPLRAGYLTTLWEAVIQSIRIPLASRSEDPQGDQNYPINCGIKAW